MQVLRMLDEGRRRKQWIEDVVVGAVQPKVFPWGLRQSARGSPHAKRWEDDEELLSVGISAVATVTRSISMGAASGWSRSPEGASSRRFLSSADDIANRRRHSWLDRLLADLSTN